MALCLVRYKYWPSKTDVGEEGRGLAFSGRLSLTLAIPILP